MSAEAGSRRLRRIIITLGDGAPEDTLLQDVMLLAAAAVAEIEAVFVEDADLFRLAALPFARQISRTTGHTGPLEVAEIEREFRHQAELSRRTLAAAADRAGVSWRFRVTRAVLTQVLTHAVTEYDLTVLSAARGWPGTVAEVGRGPVGTVIDGSESGWHALELAATLARASGQAVVAFVGTTASETGPATAPDTDQRLATTADEIRTVADSDDDTLLAALQQTRLGAVVLPARRALLHPGLVRRLRRELGCPAYLVR